MPQRTPPKKRQNDFRLPPGVSMQKEQLPSGWAYVFRHAELGLLGRLVLQGLPSGHCQVSCEVALDSSEIDGGCLLQRTPTRCGDAGKRDPPIIRVGESVDKTGLLELADDSADAGP